MQLERTKNAKRNIIVGFLQKFVGLALPFVVRTAIIYSLGVQYTGINSLFNSILNVLSMAELGFGSAMVYSMYKPIAEEDTDTICALLNFYKKCYRIIGTVVLGAGLVLTPFVPYLVHDSFPSELNIYFLYLLSLGSVVVSYFMYAYKNSLLYAHQRTDVSSAVMTVTQMLQCILQIACIVIFKNYYYYPVIALVFTAVANVCTAYFATKLYPQYTAKGKISAEIKGEIVTKVKSLFLYKIGYVVANSADTIVISAFLGLSVVAIYGNYYYIIAALFGILDIYYSSIKAGLGNKMVLESKNENYKLFNNLFFSQSWIICWMTTCLVCLYQDFMQIWVGKELMLDNKMVFLLGAYLYFWKINDVTHVFKEAAGLWEYDRLRPLISSICNLVINIILVKKIGLYGIVISTILCDLVFSLTWGSKIIFDKYFEVPFRKYILKWMTYLFINVFVLVTTYWVCTVLTIGNVYLRFALKILVCCIIPNMLLIVLNVKNASFSWFMSKAKTFFKIDKVKG